MASWQPDCKPEVVCAVLNGIRTIRSDGSVAFEGFRFRPLLATLEGMVVFDDSIPPSRRASFVSHATFDAAKKDPITATRVLASIKKQERSYLHQSNKKFYLNSRLSLPVSAYPLLPRTGCRKSVVTFRSHLTQVEQSVIDQCFDETYQLRHTRFPSNYVAVRVSVADRCSEAAAVKAIDNLDLLRFSWNLCLNRENVVRSSSGIQKPVNQILLGPVQTLHNPNGTPASSSWWYEPHFRGFSPVADHTVKVRKCLKFQKRVFSLLNGHPYKEALVMVFLRYVRALDLTDWQSAILRLWGILETITDTLARPYKVTIARASAMYENRELRREELQVLRRYRNRHAHIGEEARNPEVMMYLLKNIVESLLQFHLGNSFRFQSMAEGAAFLDLPTSRSDIQRMKKMYSYAERFRGY